MIIQYIAYTNSEGEISHLQTTPSEIPDEGTVIEGMTVHHVTPAHIGELDTAIFINRYYWKDSAWTNRGDPTNNWYNWNGTAWAVNTPRLTQEVRQERDIRLGGADWTQVGDAPLTDAKKAEWVTYRQTLRDIMTNLPADLDDPDDVVWPDTP